MTILEAAYRVLAEAGRELHFHEITDRIVKRRLWRPGGSSPAQSVGGALYMDINNHRSASHFRQTGPGTFALKGRRARVKTSVASRGRTAKRSPGGKGEMTFLDAAEYMLKRHGSPMRYANLAEQILRLGLVRTESKKPASTLYGMVFNDVKNNPSSRFNPIRDGLISLRGRGRSADKKPSAKSSRARVPRRGEMSFLDAAEHILRKRGRAMHYVELAKDIISRGLVSTKSKKPGNTLYGCVFNDSKQSRTRRFNPIKEGYISLVGQNSGVDIRTSGTRHMDNRDHGGRRKERKDWQQLEAKVADLLKKMGLILLPPKRDRGVDVWAEFKSSAGKVIRVAVQTKHWKTANVGPKPVRELGFSIGGIDVGMLVTTGGFTKEALRVPQVKPKPRIFLIDGDALDDLLSSSPARLRRWAQDHFE